MTTTEVDRRIAGFFNDLGKSLSKQADKAEVRALECPNDSAASKVIWAAEAVVLTRVSTEIIELAKAIIADATIARIDARSGETQRGSIPSGTKAGIAPENPFGSAPKPTTTTGG